MTHVLELRNLKKSFKQLVVLNDVSLEIPGQQTTVLLGPSGCGKSTLLRLMIGLERPDSGEILFEAAPVSANRWNTLRQRIGYVIQAGGLFPHLTGYENVTIMASQLGWERSRTSARIAELCELVSLDRERLDLYPHQLSGGQRQRVSLMRALMLDPPLILLDEPLGALDPLIRASLQDDLKSIFRSLNKTVVMVTHDLAEAGFFGDQVVLLDAGKIVQRGPFSEFLENPASDFVARFVAAQRSLYA